MKALLAWPSTMDHGYPSKDFKSPSARNVQLNHVNMDVITFGSVHIVYILWHFPSFSYRYERKSALWIEENHTSLLTNILSPLQNPSYVLRYLSPKETGKLL
jgi:hypothetical protein